MKKTVVVCAYNEEMNIGDLIERLIFEPIDEIIVVSSSTDETDEIVRKFSSTDPRVKLLREGVRSGMSSAMTLGIQHSCGDIIIMLAADNLPEKGALPKLFRPFELPYVGAVCNHPVPIDDPNNAVGFAVNLWWNLHHFISLGKPRVSGECFGFRSILVKAVPAHINCSDFFIQLLVEKQGSRVVYVQDSITYMKGASTIRDFVNQRKRVLVGHIQNQRLYGRKPSTQNRMRSIALLPKSAPRIPFGRRIMLTLVALSLESFANLLALFEDRKKNYHHIWQPISTTKVRIGEKHNSIELPGAGPCE